MSKKKYPTKAIQKTDREAFIACLDYLMAEFDRMQREIDNTTKKLKNLIGEENDE